MALNCCFSQFYSKINNNGSKSKKSKIVKKSTTFSKALTHLLCHVEFFSIPTYKLIVAMSLSFESSRNTALSVQAVIKLFKRTNK